MPTSHTNRSLPTGPKKKAKKASSTSIKRSPPSSNTPSSVAASDDLSSIFGALTQKKAKSAASALSSSSSPSSANTPAHIRQRNAVAAAELAAKPVRDGLYRAPEKSLHMNDLGFFGGTVRGGRTVHAPAASPAGGTDGDGSAKQDDGEEGEESIEVSEAVLTQEGVSRILTMTQLRKMLSHNPTAGSTPNCPFDCDCCF